MLGQVLSSCHAWDVNLKFSVRRVHFSENTTWSLVKLTLKLLQSWITSPCLFSHHWSRCVIVLLSDMNSDTTPFVLTLCTVLLCFHYIPFQCILVKAICGSDECCWCELDSFFFISRVQLFLIIHEQLLTETSMVQYIVFSVETDHSHHCLVYTTGSSFVTYFWLLCDLTCCSLISSREQWALNTMNMLHIAATSFEW